MKRNLVIACVTAAALVGGGVYTAVAAGSGDGGTDPAPRTVSSASLVDGAGAGDDDGRDDDGGQVGNGTGTGTGKDDGPAAGAGITAEQAAAAALKHRPGTVASVGLDDDGDDDGSSAARHWEVDVIGQDGAWYDLRVDAASGAVRADGQDDGQDDADDRSESAAVRGAAVDVREAAALALKRHPGTVTSVDADDDDRRTGRWDVTVRGADGQVHAVTVNMSSGAVAAAAARDDDGQDDRDDDGKDDDGRDDRDDRDDDDDRGDDD